MHITFHVKLTVFREGGCKTDNMANENIYEIRVASLCRSTNSMDMWIFKKFKYSHTYTAIRFVFDSQIDRPNLSNIGFCSNMWVRILFGLPGKNARCKWWLFRMIPLQDSLGCYAEAPFPERISSQSIPMPCSRRIWCLEFGKVMYYFSPFTMFFMSLKQFGTYCNCLKARLWTRVCTHRRSCCCDKAHGVFFPTR